MFTHFMMTHKFYLILWRPWSVHSFEDDLEVFSHFIMTQTCFLFFEDDLEVFIHFMMTQTCLLARGWPGKVLSLPADLQVFTHFMMTWKCLLTSWWPGSVPRPLQSLGQTGGWWHQGECCTAHCPEKEHTITVNSIHFTPTHHPHPNRMLEFPWRKLAWIWMHWKKCEFAD